MRSKSLAAICFLILAGLAGCCASFHKENNDLCAIETVRVTFETTNPGGKFGDRNVHVVWVEDSNGLFDKPDRAGPCQLFVGRLKSGVVPEELLIGGN